MIDIPEGFYTRRTEYGEVLAKDYAFNGRKYVQSTLTMGQLLDLSDLLVGLQIPGVSDVSDIDGANISLVGVLKAMMRDRMHGKALAIVLMHEDGSPCDPGEFNAGLADEGLVFLEAVVTDFFVFNSRVADRLSDWFARASSKMVTGMVGLLRRAVPSIASQAETSPDAQASSRSRKASPMSGRRK